MRYYHRLMRLLGALFSFLVNLFTYFLSQKPIFTGASSFRKIKMFTKIRRSNIQGRLSIKIGAAFFLFIFFLSLTSLFAQDYEVKHIGIPEGLSQGMITSMCQDKDGFLWVGTLSGLNRYDGYKFKTYTNHTSDKYSLAGNLITGIIEDSKGRLWIGTPEGIDCYDRNTGRFYHLPAIYTTNNKKAENITPVFESNDGHIWLKGALMVVKMTVPDDFPKNQQRINNIQYNIFESGNGLPTGDKLFDLYLNKRQNGQPGITLTDESCFTYNPQTNTWKETPISLNPNNLNAYANELIYDDYRKGYWVLSNQTLQLLKNGSITLQLHLPQLNISASISHVSHKTLCIDKYGVLWFLADLNNQKLLYRILPPDVSSSKEVTVERLFQSNQKNIEFKELLADKHNSIWLGTTGYGLIQILIKPRYFTNYFNHKSLGAINPTPNNNAIWVRSSSFMYQFQLLDLGTETLQKIAVNDTVYPVTNQIITSNGAMVSRYSINNETCFVQIAPENGKKQTLSIPKNYHLDPMIEDQLGRIWLTSSYGNISCITPPYNTVATYSFSHILQNNASETGIKQIYPSQNNVLWITTRHGLLKMEAPPNQTPKFTLIQSNPKNPNSLSSNAIYAVLDDPAQPNRYLWVATNGNGLNKMDKLTGYCQHYTKKNGLPDNVVYGILADKHGRLWLSTNYGLSCFNPQTRYFLNFTTADGLPENEFNSQSYYQNPNGIMYFGSIRGITVFNPDTILPSANFASIFFTELKINNQPIDLPDSLQILQQPLEVTTKIYLKHNQNFITITYAALDFTQKTNTKFYYKMDGIDHDWVFANNRTELSYPNLVPGNYTLRITNLNQNGDRNPQHATLTFVITPPWWQSWAAYVVYTLIMGTGVFGGFRFQANRLKLQNELHFKEKEAQNLQALDELKTRFFTNITHEFRTPLTIVIEPLRMLLQQPDMQHVKPQLQLIYNNANRLLLLVNQLLDLSKLEFGNLQPNWVEGNLILVVREIFDYFLPIAQKKQQTLTWQTTLPELHGITDRQMLEKITYNLLSNAHKFTPAGGDISVNIGQLNPDTWTLTVQDTGIGIDKKNLPFIFDRFYQTDNSLTRRGEGTGIGLALVKELCQLLNAQITVTETPGKGATFALTFPVRPNGATALGFIAPANSTFPEAEHILTKPDLTNHNLHKQPNETLNTTVLLVEDNADMRQYLKMVLSQHGYSITEAENGKQGLDTALQTVPDLIITDVMMSEMDGYTMTQNLKTNPITSHIPIVILSAKGRAESKIEGYRRGADAYLPKPFSTEELLVRITQILATRRTLQLKYPQFILPHTNNDTHNPPPPDDKIPSPDILLSTLDHQWLNNLFNSIQQNMADENFSVDDLFPMFMMNRTQFYAKVKALTGQTPARLLRNARLDKAYYLLTTQPNMHLQDVLLEVGLKDLKNFTLIFKDKFGSPPQQVQKKYLQ